MSAATPFGHPSHGLVIFAGGLRFFGLPYGRLSIPRGLAAAGFEGKVIYWPWHETHRVPGALNLAPLRDEALQDRHARRIAIHFALHAERYPDAPRHLLGCSAGGGVVLRTLAHLPASIVLDSAVLLSVAVNPWVDLATIAPRTRVLLNFYSLLDVFILGLGTMVCGTADGAHAISAGMVGLRGPLPDNVRNIGWTPAMIRAHRYGGHHSAIKSRFLARHVAPEMGIRPRTQASP